MEYYSGQSRLSLSQRPIAQLNPNPRNLEPSNSTGRPNEEWIGRGRVFRRGCFLTNDLRYGPGRVRSAEFNNIQRENAGQLTDASAGADGGTAGSAVAQNEVVFPVRGQGRGGGLLSYNDDLSQGPIRDVKLDAGAGVATGSAVALNDWVFPVRGRGRPRGFSSSNDDLGRVPVRNIELENNNTGAGSAVALNNDFVFPVRGRGRPRGLSTSNANFQENSTSGGPTQPQSQGEKLFPSRSGYKRHSDEYMEDIKVISDDLSLLDQRLMEIEEKTVLLQIQKRLNIS